MFKASNVYDELVIKATDENLTSENWELNINVCDKVTEEGESGARNCVASILKRLVHRNANVQLYALTLSDALSKNCGEVAHRELASRSYCQTLQRIVSDRNTHATVKNKALSLIKEWTSEWGNDESLGVLRETADALKRQGISLTQEEPRGPPQEPSSEQLRAEDEELRRALELSIQDQGGRAQSTSFVQGSASRAAAGSSSNTVANGAAINKSLPDPSAGLADQATSSHQQQPQRVTASRVRALHDFVPNEPNELAFRKGNVMRVLDAAYEHWWRCELNGNVGIVPVNYIEILPDPTPSDIQREAELEARIFAQANDIDRLLGKLRGLDAARDNVADDEELQELYQSSLSMRPKIVKLIDRYNLKVTELRSMNEKFVRARTTYDAMMQQSVQRHAPTPSSTATIRPFPGGSATPVALQPGARDPSQGHLQTNGPSAAPSGIASQPPGMPNPHQNLHHLQPQPRPNEHAQDWSRQHVLRDGSQGHMEPQGPSQGQHQHQQTQQVPQPQHDPTAPQLPPGAPPYGTPEYAQWYHAQQQQQQQQLPPQVSAPMQSSGAHSSEFNHQGNPSGTGATGDGGGAEHEDEKRRLFEHANAQAEAYRRAYAQHHGQQASGGAPSAPLL